VSPSLRAEPALDALEMAIWSGRSADRADPLRPWRDLEQVERATAEWVDR
jgi:hypothetical protein